MKQLKLGVDVDGVLADFNRGYLSILEHVSGGKKCELSTSGAEPNCWHWPERYGYTKAHADEAWRVIKASPMFWASLPPYLETEAVISTLRELYAHEHEVYFITNRMGLHPHAQTLGWLMNQGFPLPTVLVSEDKGPIAKGLKLTHFIDDKPENCWEVDEECNTIELSDGTRQRLKDAPCRVFMLKRAWNDHQRIVEEASERGITIVPTLRHFFEELAHEEGTIAIA